MQILAINPGSTSTKVSVYQDGKITDEENLQHTSEELAKFKDIKDQLAFRRDIILKFLAKHHIEISELNAVVGRGGVLPPVESGAYEVNDDMIHYLLDVTENRHASNLGAPLAEEIKHQANNGMIALIYDSVSVDELDDISRITGWNLTDKVSVGHVLNMRAVAHKVAEDHQEKYEDLTIITAHLGGGSSVALHHKGKIVDNYKDDEGPFSVERSGFLPVSQLLKLTQQYSYEELMHGYKNDAGLKSYLGTSDVREITKRIENGDEKAKLIFDAYIYQHAKYIASLAAYTNGEIDYIIITGGVAYSSYLVEALKKRLSFLAPIVVVPGEHEMISLSKGAERVLLGKEEMKAFKLN